MAGLAPVIHVFGNFSVQVVGSALFDYIGRMGKTVQIDDDVMRAAERLAAERGATPGEVISELARRELTKPPMGQLIEKNGFYVLPSRGEAVTSALVKRLLEDADFEDAGLSPKD